MLKLLSQTDPSWALRMAENFDEVLLDHAHCEKKAAGVAVRLIFQYPHHPEMMEPLASLAREELAHFEEVLAWLARRGRSFGRQKPSAYAGRLRELVRKEEPDRLVDMLLCCAVIEARSCERLGLLADHLEDEALAHFYGGLHKAEARHHGVYVDLACRVRSRDEVEARLREVAAHEAVVIESARSEPRLHSQ